MNREYEFSVVVFAKDTAKLYRTFKNVREVTPEGTVQILAVCIAGDTYIFNSRSGKKERVSRLFQMHSNKQNPVEVISAGDIGAGVGFKGYSYW
mgnify:CR=1 FL=1